VRLKSRRPRSLAGASRGTAWRSRLDRGRGFDCEKSQHASISDMSNQNRTAPYVSRPIALMGKAVHQRANHVNVGAGRF
jgi:hypothetical protein